VKAVNLIPADSSRGGSGRSSSLPQLPALALFGVLAIALVFVTVYVLTSNTISSRNAQIATTQTELAQAQAQAAQLSNYTQLAKLAEARVLTIQEIAASRFDWHGALVDLSRVVPSNTSLQSLLATVTPSVSTGGGSSGGSMVRSDISAPAFELTGCTKTQDDVARLMSRLRLINGVTRVTLATTAKQSVAQNGSSVGEGSAPQGCGANAPTFDVVVFFTAPPGAIATSGTQATTTTTTTTSTTSAGATTTAGGSATTTTSQTTTSSSSRSTP
jgi:Tfp pilus assembly protein PilN